MNPRDKALARIGAAHHGLATRRHLRGAGWTDGQVDHQVAIGRLEMLFDGVYRVAGTPDTWNQRMLAATYATGGVSSHRAGTLVWGADIGPVPPFEVMVEPTHCPRPRGVDFAYEAEMINIEVDGYEHHGGDYDSWEDDLERDAALTAAGWRVIRCSRNGIRRGPAKLAANLHATVDLRRRELGVA